MGIFSRSRSGPAAIIVVAWALPSLADVLKHREVELSSALDRGVLFGVALAPAGDVLSLIAKNTGSWQLYRVRHWNEEKPSVDTLTLQGFPSKSDQSDMESLWAQVFTTANGAYAVCVARVEWLKRVRGRRVGPARSDDVIAIVDLANFKVATMTHTKDLDLLEFHNIRLDRDGFVLVDSTSESKPKRGAFTRLAIPSLAHGPVCRYIWISDSSAREHREPQINDDCRSALGPIPFSTYFQATQPSALWPPNGCDKNTNSTFCRVGGSTTPDGKFGIAVASEGHDRLFDRGWVETKKSYVVYSVAKRVDIGEIRVSPRDSIRTETASLEGVDYLLVVTNGMRLTVYALGD